jgi:hypothetical protein
LHLPSDKRRSERDMAGIIHLGPGGHPPAGEDWVLIKRGRSDALKSADPAQQSRGWTFTAQPKESETAETIEAACAWADAHGIKVVYLLSLPNPSIRRVSGEEDPLSRGD